MTLWTFDLRSNDSDTEDEENTKSPLRNITSSNTYSQQDYTQGTRQKRIDRELEGLFGTPEDEEGVDYKPNPWSIAKINAHSRSTAPSVKSKPKTTWKPRDPVSKPSHVERFRKNPKDVPSGGYRPSGTSSKQLAKTGNRSLRDSISEALRRGGPTSTIPPDQEPQDGVELYLAGKPNEILGPPLTNTTPLLDSHRPLDGPVQPLHNVHQEQLFEAYPPQTPGAYIPSDLSATPIFNMISHETGNDRHMDTPNGPFSYHRYPLNETMVPAEGSDGLGTLEDSPCLTPHQVHGEAPPNDGFVHSQFQPTPSPRWKNASVEHTPDHFRIPSPGPGPEPKWTPQNRVRLASPYSDSPFRARMEPSSTVQLIARFAAPKLNESVSSSTYSEYPDPDVSNYESPLFAWTPPSPKIPATTHQTQPYTPKRTLHPIHKKQLSTPPRRKTTNRFDLEDKPFWSTLPTPPDSRFKPSANGIKASRFRLPGSFLGSSPLSGSSGRTLYKPPVRKRTGSRGDEVSARKWKVTRVG